MHTHPRPESVKLKLTALYIIILQSHYHKITAYHKVCGIILSNHAPARVYYHYYDTVKKKPCFTAYRGMIHRKYRKNQLTGREIQ